MLEFDLQRFDEEETQGTNRESESAEAEEREIPEELNGLPEEYAREILTEHEKKQPMEEPKAAPTELETYTREQYQAKINEVEQLKAQLAEYQRQQSPVQVQQPAQQAPRQPIQQPQMKITAEDAAKINQAITAEAKALSGMSDEDVASLEYADEDDPRKAQWEQAKAIAQGNIITAIRQAQINQQVQTQQFLAEHAAAVNTYNEFAQKEFAEPDYKEIVKFATNEYFEKLSANEQKILANAYIRVERQTASPAEMLVVKNYYERAKAAFRNKGAQAKNAVATPQQRAQQAAKMPRTDQLKGASTTSAGQLSASDIDKLLSGDFTKLDQKQQNFLLGFEF